MSDQANASVPIPVHSRLSPANPCYDRILYLHEEACRSGLDTYTDPQTGCCVFTYFFLLEMGNCCESGCRHCPYISPRKIA